MNGTPSRGSIAIACLATWCGVGCQSPTPTPSTDPPRPTLEPVVAPPAELTPTPKAPTALVRPDAHEAAEPPGTLAARVAAVVDACRLDRENMRAVGCGEREDERARDGLTTTQEKFEAIDDWAALLGSSDADTRFVAAVVVGPAFGALGAPDAVRATPLPSSGSVPRLLDTLAGLGPGEAHAAVHGMTHLAARAGQFDRLLADVRKHPAAEALEVIVWAEAMHHGEDRVVGKPWAEALGDGRPRVVAAAVAAPRALKWEQAARRIETCGKVQPLLAHADRTVRSAAARTLSWCGGEFVDAVLDASHKLVVAHQFPREWALVVRDLCGASAHDERPASDSQCERNASVFERAVADAALGGSSRAQALFALFRQRPNDETERLARSWVDADDASLAAAAKQIVGKLERLGVGTAKADTSPPDGSAMLPSDG